MENHHRRKSGNETDEGEPMTFKESLIFYSVVAVCAAVFTGAIIYGIVKLIYS
jgi:hypothetical protein